MSTHADQIAALEQNQVAYTQLLTLIDTVDTKLIEATRSNFRVLDRRMNRLETNVEKLMVHLGVESVTGE